MQRFEHWHLCNECHMPFHYNSRGVLGGWVQRTRGFPDPILSFLPSRAGVSQVGLRSLWSSGGSSSLLVPGSHWEREGTCSQESPHRRQWQTRCGKGGACQDWPPGVQVTVGDFANWVKELRLLCVERWQWWNTVR